MFVAADKLPVLAKAMHKARCPHFRQGVQQQRLMELAAAAQWSTKPKAPHWNLLRLWTGRMRQTAPVAAPLPPCAAGGAQRGQRGVLGPAQPHGTGGPGGECVSSRLPPEQPWALGGARRCSGASRRNAPALSLVQRCTLSQTLRCCLHAECTVQEIRGLGPAVYGFEDFAALGREHPAPPGAQYAQRCLMQPWDHAPPAAKPSGRQCPPRTRPANPAHNAHSAPSAWPSRRPCFPRARRQVGI